MSGIAEPDSIKGTVQPACQSSSCIPACIACCSTSVAGQVATGWKHSAAIGHAGQLLCWGWGGSVGTATSFETGRSSGGQLGLGNEFDYWGPTQVTDLQLAAETEQQGNKSTAITTTWNALQVSCGFNHTAAVVETTST